MATVASGSNSDNDTTTTSTTVAMPMTGRVTVTVTVTMLMTATKKKALIIVMLCIKELHSNSVIDRVNESYQIKEKNDYVTLYYERKKKLKLAN